MSGKFKVGDAIMYGEETHVCFGYGTIIEHMGGYIYKVKFKFYREMWLDLEHAPVRLASEADQDWHPPQPESESEPINAPEEATLEHLESEITSWEVSVHSLEIGNDDSYEYRHDIFQRHCLHGVLNGYQAQGLRLPDDLQNRIAIADRRFMDATFALDDHVWTQIAGGYEIYDPSAFWHYYRWPKN